MDLPNDDIPLLPPMSEPALAAGAGKPAPASVPRPGAVRRRRRGLRAVHVIALLMLTLGVTAGVAYLVARSRQQAAADSAFQEADDAYQANLFGKAARAYQAFQKAYPRDARADAARRMTQLSELSRSITDPAGEPARIVAEIDQFRSGSETIDPEQWSVVLDRVERACSDRLERAGRTLAAVDLAQARSLLDWLKGQAKSEPGLVGRCAELEKLAAETARRGELAASRNRFQQAMDQAIADPTAEHFAAALGAYDSLPSEIRTGDPSVAATHARLRTVLRERVRFEPPPDAPRAEAPVLRLPSDAFTRLARRQQHRPWRQTARTPVLVRVKDLCFGLRAETGEIRWVARVGYDAPFPQLAVASGRPVVVVTWFRQEQAVLSLIDADTAEPIWSWLPPAPLTGTAVTRDSVFAATEAGQIWQLDLGIGSPHRVAQLPEPIDSVPSLREDSGGLCVVGANQGVYLFHVSREVPECIDVVLVGRRRDTMNCHALWLPPYVVVFENDLMSRCFVRVLHEESGRYDLIRTREVEGRLWQVPVVHGPDLFFATDRWREYCFGLHPGNPGVNLYNTAASLREARRGDPALPQFSLVAELPFVSLTDELRGYELDRTGGQLIERWHRPLPGRDARAAQQITAAADLVIATYILPDQDGARVQAVSSRSGELVWETMLATAARQLMPALRGSDQSLIVRDGNGSVVHVARDSESMSSRWLAIPDATSELVCTSNGDMLAYFSDGGVRLHSVATAGWGLNPFRNEAQAVVSPITLYEGPLEIGPAGPGAGTPEKIAGRWLVFVTADRSVEVRPLDGTAPKINGSRLPAAAETAAGPAAWLAPVLVDGRHIIVAGSSGTADRLEVQQAQDNIRYLKRTMRREDLPRPATTPVRSGARLVWVGQDGRCLTLDPATLRTLDEWKAPAEIAGVVADPDRLYVGLGDGTCAAIRTDQDPLAPTWSRTVKGAEFRLLTAIAAGSPADATQRALLVADARGRVLALSSRDGAVLWQHDLPAPLALPPCRIGDDLALATIDGGLYLVPLPRPAAQKP